MRPPATKTKIRKGTGPTPRLPASPIQSPGQRGTLNQRACTAARCDGAERPQRGTASGAQAKAERSSGSGLGLSIVQAIANAHGGRATLESWPGSGTKVRVWLPVRIVP